MVYIKAKNGKRYALTKEEFVKYFSSLMEKRKIIREMAQEQRKRGR